MQYSDIYPTKIQGNESYHYLSMGLCAFRGGVAQIYVSYRWQWCPFFPQAPYLSIETTKIIHFENWQREHNIEIDFSFLRQLL
jgi:uncharacterized membrane protein